MVVINDLIIYMPMLIALNLIHFYSNRILVSGIEFIN